MSKKPTIHDQSTYTCGPYLGYYGEARCEDGDDHFHGEVLGTRDVITFAGSTPSELRQAFRDSVDDYLEFCGELGKEPEKPYSGKLLTRLPPVLHRELSFLAAQANVSLNQYISDCLAKAVQNASLTPKKKPPASRKRNSKAAVTKARKPMKNR